jgi:hypothetical protein
VRANPASGQGGDRHQAHRSPRRCCLRRRRRCLTTEQVTTSHNRQQQCDEAEGGARRCGTEGTLRRDRGGHVSIVPRCDVTSRPIPCPACDLRNESVPFRGHRPARRSRRSPRLSGFWIIAAGRGHRGQADHRRRRLRGALLPDGGSRVHSSLGHFERGGVRRARGSRSGALTTTGTTTGRRSNNTTSPGCANWSCGVTGLPS